MGQNNCNCSKQKLKPSQLPKCSLLNQQLLSQFELPNKQNYKQSMQQMCASYSIQFSRLPNKYLDLFMVLKSAKIKFVDEYYGNIAESPWVRLSQTKGIQRIPNVNLSKFCQIIKFVIKNYSNLIEQIKPIYIENAGFAICKLWINGNRVQIIIDDFIPIEKVSYQIEIWAVLLEKAMSKVLGSYKYIQQFTIGELFSQITGIPYYTDQIQTQKQNRQVCQQILNNQSLASINNNFRNFKQVLKCDQIMYETKRFTDDYSIFCYRNNYSLSHISFQTCKFKPTILKMIIPQKQTLSLRITQYLQKYKQKSDDNYRSNEIIPSLHPYSGLFIQFFIQKNGTYRSIGQRYRNGNNIYYNNIFSELEAGTYLIYVKEFREEQRLNVVAYSSLAIKFSQIFNIVSIQNIIMKEFKNQINFVSSKNNHNNNNSNNSKTCMNKLQKFPQDIKQSQNYIEIGKQVFAFVYLKQRSHKIGIFFIQNYNDKILKVVGNDYEIVVQGSWKFQKQIQLSSVKGKFVIILSGNQNQSFQNNCFFIE